MKPVLVYFITGEYYGEDVVDMEDKLKEIYPDRDTNVVYVDCEEDKYKLLSNYNLEEMDSILGDYLWEQICEKNDDNY